MYFIKRLIFAIPLLLVISALAFVLVHLAARAARSTANARPRHLKSSGS